jgi:putative ABC transport system permease protein
MRGLISHLRYTARLLLKSPGFTIATVLILGFGIGANTAIFSLVNGVLLKPLPYPNPDRLVSIYQVIRGYDKAELDYPDYIDLRNAQSTFDGLAAYANDDFTLTGSGEPERISGLYTSGSLFKVLGRPFLLGTPFGETEDNAETRLVAVISDHLWETKFHKDPNIIGASLFLNGQTFEIVGVTPAQANEWARVDVYVPLNLDSDFKDYQGVRSAHFLLVVGRLKGGMTLQQAKANFDSINRGLSTKYPASNSNVGIRLVLYLDSVVTDYAATIWLLEASVACLLLISSANVANLLLTKVQERQREVTIRAALGASRAQLISQVLFETSVLTFVGGILGLALAAWGVNLVKSLCPEDVARFQDVRLDSASLIFVLAITACTAFLAGTLPAWLGSDTDLAPALNEAGARSQTAGPRRQKRQTALVAGQVALTFLLLTAAGLLTRSYKELQKEPLGFDTNRILTADIQLPSSRYPSQRECEAALNAILEKLRSLPGIAGAALNDDMPFKNIDRIIFGVTGQPDPTPALAPQSERQSVSTDYFSVLRIPLLRGRAFTDEDLANKERVVIINQSLAQKFFPGEDPVGKQLNNLGNKARGSRIDYRIVGVVADVKHNTPELHPSRFQTYYPYTQAPWSPSPVNAVTLILSVESDHAAALPAVRRAIASLDPDLALSNVLTMDEVVAKGLTSARRSMLVVGLFSGAALLLATIGLYAVLSYSVSQRRREFGIRIALGAQAQNILRLVVVQGLRICVFGLAFGMSGALILSRFLQGVLYHVPSNDPFTLLVGVIVLGLASSVACLLPAFRATRVSPIRVLRE